jgi:hypothetical protein
MQTNRLCILTAKIGFSLFALVAIAVAQDNNAATPVRAPLNRSVVVSSAGESVQLNGMVSVQSTLATADDGTVAASYSCSVVGTGTGQASGANYSVSGTSSGKSPVNAPLPADIGLACAMSVAAGNAVQQFGITLQGSLDATGNLTSIVIRDITPR